MTNPPRSETLSLSEVEFLERLYDGDKAGGIHLKGYDLRRARERMLPMTMVEQGHLGDRYFRLTDKGRDFVDGLRSRR